MTKQFYDEGWNARIAGEPFTSIGTTRDWRDGWRDCDGVPEAEQKLMGDPPPLPKKAYPKPRDEFMLVPTEPTIAMLSAYDEARAATTMKPGDVETYNPHQSYWAMLNAAPVPPAWFWVHTETVMRTEQSDVTEDMITRGVEAIHKFGAMNRDGVEECLRAALNRPRVPRRSQNQR